MSHLQPNPSPYPQNPYPPQQSNPYPSLDAPLNRDANFAPQYPSFPQQNPQNHQNPQYPQYSHPPQQNPQPYPQAHSFNPAGGVPGYVPPAQYGGFQPGPEVGAGGANGPEMKTMLRYEVHEAEKNLKSGFMICYQVYICMLVAFFALSCMGLGIVLTIPQVANDSWIRPIVVWLLVFGIYNVVQSLMAFLSVLTKSSGKAACALYMMLVYLIPTIFFILGGLGGVLGGGSSSSDYYYDPNSGKMIYSPGRANAEKFGPWLCLFYGLAHVVVNVNCALKVHRVLETKAKAEEKLNQAGGFGDHSFNQA